jgi:TonB family protein
MMPRLSHLVAVAVIVLCATGLVAQTLGVAPLQGPFRVGGDILEPRKIVNVPPVYPPEAKAAGIQGVVILEAVISADGKVQDVRVLRGQAILTEPAIAAVRQWEYTPSSLNGVPVAVIMTVTVNFSLSNGSGGMPAASPVDATGEWIDNEGGRYQVRMVANDLFWFGANAARASAHVFHGTLTATGDYVGRWVDVPPGTARNVGMLAVRVTGAVTIDIVGNPPGFMGRQLRRVTPSTGRTLLD